MYSAGRCRSPESVLRRFMRKDADRNIHDLIQASRLFELKRNGTNNENNVKKRGQRWNTV